MPDQTSAARQMQDIAHRFAFHKADDATGLLHNEVRATLGRTATMMAIMLPAGREAAVVQTKLEEAMFWANAAIARALPVDEVVAEIVQTAQTPTEPTTAAPGGSDS
jgi:hypothetical protein